MSFSMLMLHPLSTQAEPAKVESSKNPRREMECLMVTLCSLNASKKTERKGREDGPDPIRRELSGGGLWRIRTLYCRLPQQPGQDSAHNESKKQERLQSQPRQNLTPSPRCRPIPTRVRRLIHPADGQYSPNSPLSRTLLFQKRLIF